MRHSVRVLLASVTMGGAFLGFGGIGQAQDMPTFLRNLNSQMSTAYGHYRAGVQTYRSVPVQNRLDYKCLHGDKRACYVHQKQLDNANEYMARHYRSLGQ